MSKSLGIYIENNIIKYAKVSKEHDNIKVETYGVRVFESLGAEIKKIIEETYSFNTPISINLANEKYLYFDIFALLNKKDISKAVETEFETYCEEKKYNQNAFETRYALVQNIEEKEKLKAIDIAVNKIELNKQMQPFESYKLSKVLPLPMTIADIADIDKKENVLILNMEEVATITTVIDQKIYDIEILDVGSQEVLDKINREENSYSKAYEICKNTTIYTAEMEGMSNEQPHLQYIIPTVYSIREKIQEIIMSSSVKYDKLYLTGTLAAVNNIDLYFQEILQDTECKILKPKFIVENATQVNIKDYIEVNSAIALAVNSLGEGSQTINFKKTGLGEKLSQALSIETKGNSKLSKLNTRIDFNMSGSLDSAETWSVRAIVAIVLIAIIFSVFSKILSIQMDEKEKEIDGLKTMQRSEITKIEGETSSLNSKNTKYQQLIKRLEEIDDKLSDIAESKNSIPNLLNQIMYIIPESVQLTSIDNTTNKHIVIKAQAAEYDQLGYFIAKMKTKKILRNVVSSSGLKSDKTITVTIEGDLP
ncbi:MAG: hypothetical protein HFJ17_03955 [Clostridia bacterium]|nr:hypothetical protein [Clostridia bacterium]